MTIEQCRAYYKQFTNVGAMEHSGAAAGQVEVDFRNDKNPQRRVYLAFKKSDGKVLLVITGNLGRRRPFPVRRNRNFYVLMRVTGLS